GAPDAYEGAPTSIAGFMSVAVKAAAWAMLLRIVLIGLGPLRSVYVPLFIFVSIASMTAANLAALTQSNMKRLLAYSSIAHIGYMLLGLVAGTTTQVSVGDRKSTRLNSSHRTISYAVFCLKKKTQHLRCRRALSTP